MSVNPSNSDDPKGNNTHSNHPTMMNHHDTTLRQRRPSDARRMRLKQSDTQLVSLSTNRISNFIPIERYYTMANKLFNQFLKSFTTCTNHPSSSSLDVAYILGSRFALFSLNLLPYHDYYKLNHIPHLIALRNQNILDVTQTISLLEEITQRMDEEEYNLEKEEEQGIEMEYDEWKKQRESKYNDDDDDPYNSINIKKQYEADVPSSSFRSNSSSSSSTVAIVPPTTSSSISNSSYFSSSSSSSWEHKIPIQTLTELYTEDYISFKRAKRIQYTYLPTYQGKKTLSGKDSTNGCTVISALMVAFHLAASSSVLEENNNNKKEQEEDNEEDDFCLTNIEIQSVIDDISPDLLIHIRSKLGLGNNALIIPSDVHDYLLELQILQQEQFVGVVGGNILDETHVYKLIQGLKQDDPRSSSKDTTATYHPTNVAMSLFFHEHVISILTVYNHEGRLIRYDWIDSMPHAIPQDEEEVGVDDVGAVRIQCMDIQALEVLIRWYACETFTEKDRVWMDQQEWDESLCDTDPRVFQAYIWKQV